MFAAKSIHLFNCDCTVPLDSVADLLNVLKERLPFPFSIEKHDFISQRIGEKRKQASKMKMDFAILVVHANESPLTINETTNESGYTTLYKALLKATGLGRLF